MVAFPVVAVVVAQKHPSHSLILPALNNPHATSDSSLYFFSSAHGIPSAVAFAVAQSHPSHSLIQPASNNPHATSD
ncbi:hypothetical protein FRX31_030207, partial [Thalictrum thalictroides]